MEDGRRMWQLGPGSQRASRGTEHSDFTVRKKQGRVGIPGMEQSPGMGSVQRRFYRVLC